jgi:acetyltransferase-like isoleucine patch superfamily enzyme
MSLRRHFDRWAADAVHAGWAWAGRVGTVGPDDRRGRRYARMGAGSAIAFPPGVVFGEQYIGIGAKTMIGPYVTMAVGMGPGEPIDVPGGVVISIGDRCVIGRGVSLVGRRRIVIEDDVTFAPDIYVTDHNHAYNDVRIPIGRQWLDEDPVRIGARSWIGTGVVVLPGADIGRHVTVAAGSVVRGSVPDYSVVAGAPARVVRRYVAGEGWVPPLRHEVVTPPWWIVDDLSDPPTVPDAGAAVTPAGPDEGATGPPSSSARRAP